MLVRGKRIMIKPRKLGKLQLALDLKLAMDPYLDLLLGTLWVDNLKWDLKHEGKQLNLQWDLLPVLPVITLHMKVLRLGLAFWLVINPSLLHAGST